MIYFKVPRHPGRGPPKRLRRLRVERGGIAQPGGQVPGGVQRREETRERWKKIECTLLNTFVEWDEGTGLN